MTDTAALHAAELPEIEVAHALLAAERAGKNTMRAFHLYCDTHNVLATNKLWKLAFDHKNRMSGDGINLQRCDDSDACRISRTKNGLNATLLQLSGNEDAMRFVIDCFNGFSAVAAMFGHDDPYKLARTLAAEGSLEQEVIAEINLRLQKVNNETSTGRVEVAIELLKDMIDGAEECRGRDSELTHIIGVLEGNWHHVDIEPRLSLRVNGLQPNEA